MTLLRRPSRRTATAAALALAVGALGSSAVAATLAGATDGSLATPVERFRADNAAARTAEAPGDAELVNFQHVYNYKFPGFSATDQGTDIEFYSPTVTRTVDGVAQQVTLDVAVVGSYDRGAFLFDITDPDKPSFISQVNCRQRQNDVQLRQFGDTWLLMLTNDNSGTLCAGSKNVGQLGAVGGIAVFDVTDPAKPKSLYNLRITDGAHNFTWHPTKPVGWVSTGEIIPSTRTTEPEKKVGHIPVIDFKDPFAPVVADDFLLEGSPHDITFSADGSRAYVAAQHNVRVYDTRDPLKPVLLQRGASLASYVHGTDPTPDGKTLLVTDESLVLGGFFAGGSTVCPGGGITFFDATSSPMKPLSYALADVRGPGPDARACTAHVGSFTPDSKTYVTGWYVGGVRVFDIADPSAPKEIGRAVMPGTEVWAAKFHKGQYVFTGDLGRGFDVFKWTGPALGTKSLG